ncbi:MAG: transposase, partial [Candidatus Koribacter versatilis]|nr:transposase [Candidatus Koribacter versatilis]
MLRNDPAPHKDGPPESLGGPPAIEQWRSYYNGERPHSALGYKTPEEYAAEKSKSFYGEG